jgi:hypothetical protein|tara:strand:+ start:388 stop:510 length:123 start_codon:yes stop_codon:yes gene_type:complete
VTSGTIERKPHEKFLKNIDVIRQISIIDEKILINEDSITK